MHVSMDRGLTAQQIYVMYFCKSPRHHEKAWSAVETQLAQVRAVHDTILPLASRAEVDWDDYLAKIRTVFPTVERIDIRKVRSMKKVKIPEVLYNEELIPLYTPDGEPWIPSEDGYYEAEEISLTPAAQQRREHEWTAAERQLERVTRKFVRLSLPHTSAMAVSDVIVANFMEEWRKTLAEQFRTTVREQLGLHDIWQDCTRLFGFFPEHHAMGYLTYHALFAAFMDRIDVSEKILAVMRYVAIAPGYLPKDDPTTWIAYTKVN